MPAAALSAADIISAIEFDKTGEQLATGDRGGRVVLFQRQDNKPNQQVLGPGAHIARGLTLHQRMQCLSPTRVAKYILHKSMQKISDAGVRVVSGATKTRG